MHAAIPLLYTTTGCCAFCPTNHSRQQLSLGSSICNRIIPLDPNLLFESFYSFWVTEPETVFISWGLLKTYLYSLAGKHRLWSEKASQFEVLGWSTLCCWTTSHQYRTCQAWQLSSLPSSLYGLQECFKSFICLLNNKPLKWFTLCILLLYLLLNVNHFELMTLSGLQIF